MQMISIPPIVMASVTMFVSLFSFVVFIRRRSGQDLLHFAITCFLFGLYDLFCAALYSSGSVEEGIFWQRLQLATLALSGISFIRFTHFYTGKMVSTPVFLSYSVLASSMALIGLWSESDLVWKISQPHIKVFDSFLFGEVVYYEAVPGPIMDAQGILATALFVYLGMVAFKFRRSGQKRRANRLIIAMGLFFMGLINDTLIAWGVYSSVYTLEYSYMAMVILMTWSMGGEMVASFKLMEEREHLREQLRQAQKMEAIGRLAGGIAHDLNNMLTPIIGYVDMARRRRRTEDQLKMYLERIGEAAEHSRKLTWQLLAFGRKQILNVKVVSLNDLIHNAENMLSRLIPEDVEILTELDPSAGSILADDTQVQQIIINLALNARDAMPDGGKMVFRTFNATVEQKDIPPKSSILSGEYTVLQVDDTGCGMDELTVARVFEPFFTTKDSGSGTGLGLSTVYGIARQHDGFVKVTSTPGKGSVFSVYLPRVEQAGAVASIAPPELIAENSGERILLVEDERVVRELAKEALETHGYVVESAESADHALEIVKAADKPPNLLLTDVVMPGMTGPQLYQRIVGEGIDIKVLFMSGYAGDIIAQRGVLEDDMVILHKPFSVSDLLAAVRGTIDYQAHQESERD